jgi:hypothetical protein
LSDDSFFYEEEEKEKEEKYIPDDDSFFGCFAEENKFRIVDDVNHNSNLKNKCTDTPVTRATKKDSV